MLDNFEIVATDVYSLAKQMALSTFVSVFYG